MFISNWKISSMKFDYQQVVQINVKGLVEGFC